MTQFAEFQGNNGGSFISLSECKNTENLTLRIGHDCVLTCDVIISVCALCTILTDVFTKEGFRARAKAYYENLDEIPKWLEPIP